MGNSSRLIFPLPRRKSKAAAPPPIPGPLTKVQKLLGTAQLNVEAGAFATDAKWAWEAQSNSGISIAVTETTNGEAGMGRARDGRAEVNARREKRWDDDSEIIPPVFHRQAGPTVPDALTDASSLRRRQSSSTITSFYDKSKLPLSISQQTSNSAMAKGLPPKAQALLDIDGQLAGSRAKQARKRPSRLDLASLLSKSRSPKHVHPESNNPEPISDVLTKSPSLMSVSPAPAPPPILQRAERKVRKKLTKESLRDIPTQQASSKYQPSRTSLDLHNLYDHYEQRSYAAAMNPEFYDDPEYLETPTMVPFPSGPPAPASNGGKSFLSPFSTNPSRANHPSRPALPNGNTSGTRIMRPSSPVSTAADCASVSSRHTWTSKASKRTDHSFNEIDLLQNSVLALSSDSEDDYEHSSKGSLMVPALSDGQTSPTTPPSALTRHAAEPYDDNRSKPVKRTSFAASAQVFPASQAPAPAMGPSVSPRPSSLTPTSAKPTANLAHETSRLSIATTSTVRTVSRVSVQGPGPHRVTAVKSGHKSTAIESQFDFPAPPTYRAASRASVQPALPTSVDLYLQTHHSHLAPDNGSIRSGTSLGSAANGGRRGSAASSLHDGNSGRFMAVTRQEEMLLAALRMKRARMREDMIAEYEEEMEQEEHHELRRQVTSESNDTMGSGLSRQSSRSTMRQETAGTLSARPREQSRPRTDSTTERKKGERRTTVGQPPGYEVNNRADFIDFDGHISPAGGELRRQSSKPSSIESQKSASGSQRSSGAAAAPAPAPAPRKSQRRDGGISSRPDQASAKGHKDLPLQIVEEPAEDQEGIPRPDSPVSPISPFYLSAPVALKSKKEVRLSAVGFFKHDLEAAW